MKFSKANVSLKAEIRDAVLLLRFRTIKPKTGCTIYSSYAHIRRALRMNYNTVQHVCRHALKKASRKKKVDLSRKLE